MRAKRLFLSWPATCLLLPLCVTPAHAIQGRCVMYCGGSSWLEWAIWAAGVAASVASSTSASTPSSPPPKPRVQSKPPQQPQTKPSRSRPPPVAVTKAAPVSGRGTYVAAPANPAPPNAPPKEIWASIPATPPSTVAHPLVPLEPFEWKTAALTPNLQQASAPAFPHYAPAPQTLHTSTFTAPPAAPPVQSNPRIPSPPVAPTVSSPVPLEPFTWPNTRTASPTPSSVTDRSSSAEPTKPAPNPPPANQAKSTNDACKPGETLVCVSSKDKHCVSADVMAIYKRVGPPRGFVPEISAPFTPTRGDPCKLNTVEKQKLRELVCTLNELERSKTIALTEEDRPLTTWWSYREGILERAYAPWGYVNCNGHSVPANLDKASPLFDVAGKDCERPDNWQVGYGTDVSDRFKGDNEGHLKHTIEFLNPTSSAEKAAEQIGNNVIKNAQAWLHTRTTKLDGLRFPAWSPDDWLNPAKLTGDPPRSNYFWASLLMRDPKISAFTVVKHMRTFTCYCDPVLYPDNKCPEERKIVHSSKSWCVNQKSEYNPTTDTPRMLAVLTALRELPECTDEQRAARQ